MKGLFPKGTIEYLKTLVVLLVMAIPLTFIVNCSFDVDETEISVGIVEPSWDDDKDKSQIDGLLNSEDETRVWIRLSLSTPGSEDQVDLSWTPPIGASDFQFEALQPANPGGPPPFFFNDVPLRQNTPDTPDLVIQYLPPAVGGDTTFVDTFVAALDSNSHQAFSRSYVAGTLPSVAVVENTNEMSGKAGGVEIGWQWRNWFYIRNPDQMEQSEAEELVEYLQSGAFFIGLRFPVDHEADVLEYDLPVVMISGQDAHLAILDHSIPWDGSDLSQAVADLLLEYDPARQEFLENSLPKHDSTRWAALRPSRDPIEILDRFPIAGSDWELFSTGLLDLHELPNHCTECVPEIYLCHEGQDPPAFLDILFGKAVNTFLGAAVVSYQGEGITCAGPAPIRLADTSSGEATNPPFSFDGAGFDAVVPPARTELFHDIWVTGNAPVSVTLQVESSMGLGWKLYRGDFVHADLSRPINGPLTLNPNDFVPVWIVGDVAADANGTETVTLTAQASGDASQSTWTTTNLWIGDWIPPEGGQWSGWIPVVSHASGAQGSSWRSDLGLLNRGTVAVDASITLWTQGGPLTTVQTVPPGVQVILKDVVDEFSFSGAAALEVTASSGLVLSSRTYSVVGPTADCFPEGSLGQSLAGCEASKGLTSGESGLIPQLQENSAYRTNVAVINTGSSQASVRVHLIDGDGTELVAYEVDLSPGQWKQDNRPFFARAGQSDMTAGYVRVEVLSGFGIVAYGSVVDNITNDPTTMAMTTSGGFDTAWIPVASHASGAQGSSWRTDLGLLNMGLAAAETAITLHTNQGPVTLTRSVPGGSQVILGDVVGQIGFSGSGALEIEASRPLIVTSRTYSQVGSAADCFPDGTMGQSLESSADGEGLAVGQAAVIPQLQENPASRSNVAVINTGASPAEVRVHLIDETGNEAGAYTVNLEPGQWKQENRPFYSIAAVSNLDEGYAKIEVISGSGIVGYGSVVDNTTNDPTTMTMIR